MRAGQGMKNDLIGSTKIPSSKAVSKKKQINKAIFAVIFLSIITLSKHFYDIKYQNMGYFYVHPEDGCQNL